jgi:hypothetical protein
MRLLVFLVRPLLCIPAAFLVLFPAQAGTQECTCYWFPVFTPYWIPVFTGMTEKEMRMREKEMGR